MRRNQIPRAFNWPQARVITQMPWLMLSSDISKGVELITGEKEKKDYFSDHPLTPTRAADIRKDAPKYKPMNSSHVTKSKELFQMNFNGLCIGSNPKQGIFKDSLFIHPDLRFSVDRAIRLENN